MTGGREGGRLGGGVNGAEEEATEPPRMGGDMGPPGQQRAAPRPVEVDQVRRVESADRGAVCDHVAGPNADARHAQLAPEIHQHVAENIAAGPPLLPNMRAAPRPTQPRWWRRKRP